MSAAAQAKDLNYYLTHTDEMPTDPKEIERLANDHMTQALEAGTEQLDVEKIVGKADEPDGAAAANSEKQPPEGETKPAEGEAKPAAGEQAAEGEENPTGILSKDGKNIIPYSQLESARQRAAAAEALAREQAAELTQLKAAKAAPAQVEDAEMLTDEELDALEADSPTLAKMLRAQQAAIRGLREQMEQVGAHQAEQVASEAEVVKSEIQTAIDANPHLAAWQTAEDQTAWETASTIDKAIRVMPQFANVSFADRFKVVAKMTQDALGMEPDPAPRQEREELTPEQIQAAAQAKLKAAQAGKKPVSLSDVPGGAPPAVDERQKVEEMSTVALGQQFLGMTKDQMDAYLASL